MAIKTIKKSKIETEADLIRIRREIQIMSSVQHPNIIHIYEGERLFLIQPGVKTDKCLHFAVFENKEKMVLVMEIAAGGELYDYISDRKTLGEPDARRIFRQIATAIYYCHKVGVSASLFSYSRLSELCQVHIDEEHTGHLPSL